MNKTVNEHVPVIAEKDLVTILSKHPWCSIAQLYLSANYKKTNNSLLDNQLQQTALFFQNTNWLDHQMNTLALDRSSTTNSESQQSSEETIIQSKPDQQPANDEPLAFEPYHTIDYFASQGIKMAESKTADKLSVQMKSFTEWLKSMKKINTKNLQQVDEQTEKNIQHIAESSNTASEVVTESMAEVLVKQGKNESAIEIYQKLSLLNPSKMAYFAAQIDSLKAN